jgi:DNA-binding transcriptional MerR regulator
MTLAEVQRAIGRIRSAGRDALNNGRRAAEERDALKANPDYYRGTKTIPEALSDIRQRAASQHDKAVGSAAGAAEEAERWLGVLRSRRDGRRSYAEEHHAWLSRWRPLLDAGYSLSEVVRRAAEGKDEHGLRALDDEIGPWLLARSGPKGRSEADRQANQARQQIEAALLPLLPSDERDEREAARELAIAVRVAGAELRFARRVIDGSATPTDQIALGMVEEGWAMPTDTAGPGPVERAAADA